MERCQSNTANHDHRFDAAHANGANELHRPDLSGIIVSDKFSFAARRDAARISHRVLHADAISSARASQGYHGW